MIHYQDSTVTVHLGDCIEVMAGMAADSVDAICTDPPYGLGFMGKAWDDLPPGLPWARECLRVLKPGGHLLAFGGTRTWHRLVCAVEDAGFEIRDSIAWLYGSGFPKSLDVSKAIDRRRDWSALELLQSKVRDARTRLGISQSEAARRVGLIGPEETLGGGGFMWFETGTRTPTRAQYPQIKAALGLDDECDLAFVEAERARMIHETQPGMAKSWDNGSGAGWNGASSVDNVAITEDAQRWQGWGTALKPAHEPICVARKPIVGTVAANVLRHGTGALNIDATRIGTAGATTKKGQREGTTDSVSAYGHGLNGGGPTPIAAGRWPANVVLDETQAEALDQMSGELQTGGAGNPSDNKVRGSVGPTGLARDHVRQHAGDSGGASRFFCVAREDEQWPTSSSNPVETDSDLCILTPEPGSRGPTPEQPTTADDVRGVADQAAHSAKSENVTAPSPITGSELPIGSLGSRFIYTAKADSGERINHHGVTHATVKPLSLMRWLVRLVTPLGGTILDPFAGSGTTVEAALLENFHCVAIEREVEYLPLITQRVNRRRDPIAYITAAGEDLGLFG